MYDSQVPWVELYRALVAYDGADAYDDLLAPWPWAHPGECAWLAELARRTDCGAGDVDSEDLCRLDAAFRVTSLLLLRGPPPNSSIRSDTDPIRHRGFWEEDKRPDRDPPLAGECTTTRDGRELLKLSGGGWET